MTFSLDLINIFVLIVVVLNSLLGLFVYLTKKESDINQSFFVFSIAATCWGLSMFLFRSTAGQDVSVFWSRVLYVSAATIPYVFLYFIRVFPEEKYGIPKKYDIPLTLPYLAIVFISIMPDMLITGTSDPFGQEQIINFSFIYHSIYASYIILYFSICYVLLFIKYLKFSGVEKVQTTYVVVGTFISTVIGVSTNLIMPYLGDFSLNWMGQIGIIAMIGAISYSILQHKLFDMKVLATQFIVFILSTSLFARMLFSSSRSDLIINAIFLLITIVVGLFLIRSVIKEVALREKVEKLAVDLEKANARLTELDQLKSEFLSLATHQIRAPLTAVKGYASLILEGDYGEVSEQVKHAVHTIFESCQNLVTIVNEFLDISRIEQGRMKYDSTEFDVSKLTAQILDELKPNIEKARLSVTYITDPNQKFSAFADLGKVKQVIGNIIDNSIKYTPEGGLTVGLTQTPKTVIIKVADTGIGIDKDDIPKLFGKFVRTKDANKTNVIGTGLGLYVAKQMVEAMNGKIWVESSGKEKGSQFYIELPKKA